MEYMDKKIKMDNGFKTNVRMEKNDILYKTVVFLKNVVIINRIIHRQKVSDTVVYKLFKNCQENQIDIYFCFHLSVVIVYLQ